MTAAAVSEVEHASVQSNPRFYYGWVNLLMASVAMTATLPGRTHGLGLISKPLTEDVSLGVNEALFSYLNFWAILIGAAICLPIGRAIDRIGVRYALVGVALILGLAVAAQSQVTNWIGLLVTLILVRGFGQGALSVVSMAMIGKWFTRRLGMAMGIFSVLLAIGFIATTLGTGFAVGDYGWRTTWLTIAGCLLLGLVPLGWLLVRNSPESMGLAVDAPRTAAASETVAPLDATLWEALRSPSFWIFTLAAAMFNLTWSAITLFQESLLADRGFGHNAFVLVMGLLVAGGLPANLLTGWLATPGRLGRLLAVGMLMLAVSLTAFPWLQTSLHAMYYGTALGVSGGIITVIFFSAYGQTFGRTHLGAIQATVQAVSVLASASGPVLLTFSKSYGSTTPFFYGTAATAILMAGLAWTLPTRQPSSAIE
jgi:predicted MFS family arabinose efflux permease